MKKLLIATALILLATCLLTACSRTDESMTESTEATVSYDPTKFDENNIVLSFGAISDIHIGENEQSEAKFLAAVEQLKQEASVLDADGLDAVVIAGDITHNGLISEAQDFARMAEATGMADKIFITAGNHDLWGDNLNLARFRQVLGDRFFASDLPDSNPQLGTRHIQINGCHFLILEPDEYDYGIFYPDEAIMWLDEQMAAITAEDPNAYVFVFSHPTHKFTCYGSDIGLYWFSDHLTPILLKYPQIITISGHVHFPIADERSIFQGYFTAVGCGAVANAAAEEYFLGVEEGVPANGYHSSTGLLVQLDKNGNCRFTRMNFTQGSTIKQPWELSFPADDNSHMHTYTNDRANHSQAPTLSGQLSAVSKKDKPRVITLSWRSGQDDDFVHHYRIDICTPDGKEVLDTHYYLPDYFLYSDPGQIDTFHTTELPQVAPSEYLIAVYAVDSWDHVSEPITCPIRIR